MLDGGLLVGHVEGVEIGAVKLLPVPDMLTLDVFADVGY